MPVLKNSRHERFCQAIVSGMAAAPAYVAAGYKEDRSHAAKLATKSHIVARIEELNTKVAEAVGFTKAEGLKFLADVIRTAVGNVDETSPLCQEVTRDELGGAQGQLKRGNADRGNELENDTIIRTKVKLPSKLEAYREIAKTLGWYAAEQHDLNAGLGGKIEIILRKL